MKLAIFVLQNTLLEDQFTEVLYNHGITGGTVLESTGLAKKMMQYDDGLFEVLSTLVSSTTTSKTYFFCLKESQLKDFKKICNEVTGGLKNPNTGILMIVPLEEVIGSFIKE